MVSKSWGKQKSLLLQLQKLWDKGLLLQESVSPTDLFPKRLIFKTPTGKALSQEFESVRTWVSEIKKVSGFRIEYSQIRHRIIGENSVPSEAWIDSLDLAAELLGKKKILNEFSQLYSMTMERLPLLANWMTRNPLKLLTLASEWQRLTDFVCWRKEQQNAPDIYLRQVPIAGIDSKFIEQNRAVLIQLLDESLLPDQIDTEYSGVKFFAQRYGFRAKPERIRFRLLDEQFSLFPAQKNDIFDQDITLTIHDFYALWGNKLFRSKIEKVFITENEINFLTFPKQANSLVIFGAGYGFASWSQITWLHSVKIYYWGDIDTHGFAILNQLREKFPATKSILMDEAIFKRYRPYWGNESKQENRTLNNLNEPEQSMYQRLIANEYGDKLRQEQEQINFDDLNKALSSI